MRFHNLKVVILTEKALKANANRYLEILASTLVTSTVDLIGLSNMFSPLLSLYFSLSALKQ